MPKYDFQCVVCNEIYKDVEKPMNDDKGVWCCDTLMQQIYSAPAVQFKGTGWGKDA